MNFKNTAVRFREKEGFAYVFLVLYALILLLWYSYTTSPLYNRIGFDSEIFKIMGIGILEGKVPYRDLFDHKGPVIFFINALGQLIVPGRTGLFLLQTVSLSCAFALMYKISRLFSSVKKSVAVALLIGLFMTAFGAGGNQVEEWELPWQLLAVYLALKYLIGFEKNPVHPPVYTLIYGICFGIVSFTRLNDGALIAGMMIGFAAFLILKKQQRQLPLNIALFLSGWALTAVPVLLYFGRNGALSEFFYGSYIHNFLYAADKYSLKNALIRIAQLAVPFAVLFFDVIRHRRTEMVPVVTGLVSAALTMGAAAFEHYYLTLLPLFLMVLNIVFSFKKSVFVVLMTILLFFPFSHFMIVSNGGRFACFVDFSAFSAPRLQVKNKNAFRVSIMDDMSEIIPQAERSKIWVFNIKGGGPITVGLFSQELMTTPQNRFFLPFQLKFNPEAAAEERAAFLSNPPLWILCGFPSPELPKTLPAAEDPSGIWNDILTGYECVYSKTGNYREKATVFLLKKK